MMVVLEAPAPIASPPCQNGTPTPSLPPITAEQVRDEYITQRINLWLSRKDKEPITALEAAMRVTGLNLDRPLSLPEMIKPACLIPTVDGAYYYVPCEDHFDGASDELLEKARRIDACARNPIHAQLMEEVERLLDQEILVRAHLEGYGTADIARLSAKLPDVPFTKKVWLNKSWTEPNGSP